jgi:hypothetical protein
MQAVRGPEPEPAGPRRRPPVPASASQRLAAVLARVYVGFGVLAALGFFTLGFIRSGRAAVGGMLTVLVLMLAELELRRRTDAPARRNPSGVPVDQSRARQLSAWMGRPPGLLYQAVVLGAAALLVRADSLPWFDWERAAVPGSVLMIAGTIWAMRWERRFEGVGRGRYRRGGWSWFAVPAVVTTVALCLCLTSVPWTLRWASARSRFDQAVADHRSRGGSIGGVPFSKVVRQGRELRFIYDGPEWEGMMRGSDTEIVYSPDGPPDVEHVRDLGGGWYLAWEEWD